MKKLVLFITLLAFSGCTTTQQLRTQPQCSVWKDQGMMGPYDVTVRDNHVTAKSKCLLWFWWCSSFEGTIQDDGKIQVKRAFGKEQHIATLRGDQVIYESSIFDKLVKTSPVQLDMANHQAKKTVAVGFAQGTENELVLEFNPACSKQQAAVGAVSIWVLENIR